MSTPTPSPLSIHSNQDDSRDTTSSEFSNTSIPKYDSIELSQRNDCKTSGVTSHGVEDILSEGVNYNVNDNVFTDCKPEVLSSIPNSFVQDYNSRDSTGFSIQDILGLHQSYNAVITQDDLEPRFEYQMPNYDNISNNSNNYGSGTEEVISEDCIDKNDNTFSATTTHIGNQVIYTKSYAANELARYPETSGLGSNVPKDSTREINDLHDHSFPSQVNAIEKYVLLK